MLKISLYSEVSVETVMAHLTTLDVSKATGADGLIKEVAEVIFAPSTALYNQSLQDSIVPAVRKQPHVTLIHKEGSVDDPSSDRPIAVVPVLTGKDCCYTTQLLFRGK